MRSATPVLDLDRVAKRFGRRQVLSDVSLTIRPSESWVVRGSNGSGKSTLLRVAAGLARPSGGTVVRGASTVYVPAAVVLPRRTPLRRLLEGLNAMTGVADPLDEALEVLGCRDHLDQPADTLSTGTALKALIAQALASGARLVVLDEPAAHLDDDATDGLAGLVARALDRGTAVLTAGASGRLPRAGTVELASGRLSRPGTA